jgi:hypothetical protein
VTPTDFAADELALWERALEKQHAAERQLERARSRGSLLKMFQILRQLRHLRTRADLLLAHAVKTKCAVRDDWVESDRLTSTQLGLPEDR